ncbi:putative disease resistance RPP13-like protein 2 [Hordeum vulgare]|nr:putative disease resistance RPP13-like protein 2 [Hordeum vulgare]
MRALVWKLDMLLLAPPPGCSSESVKHKMQLLKEDVEEISSCLGTLSQVEDPPQSANCWMNEVRDLSYNMEDYIDSLYMRAADPSIVADDIKTSRSHRKWFSHVRNTKKLTCGEQIAGSVSEFRIYVGDAMKRHKMYGLNFFSTLRSTLVPIGHILQTPTSYEETSDIVINERMHEFITSLANNGVDKQQLKVVSVLGSACLGKTTLVRVLYNRIGLQFDCRAFIRVSKNPDMKKIFRDTLLQLDWQQHPPQYCKEVDLINMIKNYLQDKRYLIIIDDVWSTSVWDSINRAFPKVSHGSRIITTTQIEDVAFRCCRHQSEQVFEMKPLDDHHSRKLFFNRLFGSESNCPEQFKKISNKIVAMCGGLPLATISIASLLASQPATTEDLLKRIHDSLCSLFSASATSERTRQALNLSFDNLPQYLKTCLLYVSMYQEGYTFCKNDLVKQWMAERFIDTTNGEDMEKVAESYLHQLIGRRFIQPIRMDYNNGVLSCVVHDVVHDLIAQKSAEDNFIVAMHYSEKNVELSHKARRLSILFDDATDSKEAAYIIKSKVRSLTFLGLFECMPSIPEFKLLRVLNLQLSNYGGSKGLGHDDNPVPVDLSVISELSRLRYLKIASHLCIKLPDYMGGVHCLETLDIMDAIVLKFGISACFPYLLHLYLSLLDERNVQNWIEDLDKLKHLQDLRLIFSSAPSLCQDENMRSLRDFISGHGNLKTIVVSCGSPDKVIDGASDATISWDDMAPPPLLQRFEFSPHRGCTFSRIPPWVEKHHHLSILKIDVQELQMICVEFLRGLPALTALSLHVDTMPVHKIIFDKPGFSVLKYFRLKFMNGIGWLKFEEDAMPNLLKLKLVFNAIPQIDQYEHGVISINHMPSLREISVKFGGTTAGREYAFVNNHKSNPRINRQSVVYSSYGDDNRSQKLQTYKIVEEERDEIMKGEKDEYDKELKSRPDQRISRSLESSSRPCVRAVPIDTMGQCCDEGTSWCAMEDDLGVVVETPSPPLANGMPQTASRKATPVVTIGTPRRHKSGSTTPARSTSRMFFKNPFTSPSPAKHIRSMLAKRLGGRKPKKGTVPEKGGSGVGTAGAVGDGAEVECLLDKAFGFRENCKAKYELGEEVGRGHSGYVCAAVVKKGKYKGQTVAVKIIPKAKMTTAISIEDVRREVKILKALSGHKNLVKFYDACEDDNNVYIVMELCEGGELLDRILARGGRYIEEDAKAIVVQILSAVAFCHLQGVVHRDLKPQNFLFTTRDENAPMKLIDFGLSDFIVPDERLSDIIGSAYYVAPEVLHRSYSEEADIWSIGVITYILLCGSRPFWAPTESGIFRSVLENVPNLDDSPWPSVSAEAKDFVKICLNKDYRKRMSAVQALTHPWLQDDQTQIPLDRLIYRFIKKYLHVTLLKRLALKALSKALKDSELLYLRLQFELLEPTDGVVSIDNFRTALTRYLTDAMKESRTLKFLDASEFGFLRL